VTNGGEGIRHQREGGGEGEGDMKGSEFGAHDLLSLSMRMAQLDG
jgi:hypothetical protein